MAKYVYKSKIDRWLVVLMICTAGVLWLSALKLPWWYGVFVAGGMTVLFVVGVFGCRYEIDGDTLVVYQFFRPYRMPVSKIASVKKMQSYIATAGMSAQRVSIRFSDPSVLKSFAPIEISPSDRDGFIARLKEINPDIVEE